MELFDLTSDPGEASNVLSANKTIAASLLEHATRIVASGRTTDGDVQPNDTSYWSDLGWLTEKEYETAVDAALERN